MYNYLLQDTQCIMCIKVTLGKTTMVNVAAFNIQSGLLCMETNLGLVFVAVVN